MTLDLQVVLVELEMATGKSARWHEAASRRYSHHIFYRSRAKLEQSHTMQESCLDWAIVVVDWAILGT